MVSAVPLIFSRPQFPCELRASRNGECPVQVPSRKPSWAGVLALRPALHRPSWDSFAPPLVSGCFLGATGL